MTPPGGSLSLHGVWVQCLKAWSLYHMALTCRLNASPSSLMGKTARSSQTGGKVSQVGITGRWSGGLQLSVCLGNWEEQLGLLGLPLWLRSKESTCQCRRCGFDPWVGKIPWKRKWQPTPVFLPEKFYGQRSPVGVSPWSCKRVGYDLVTNNNNISCDFKWSSLGADQLLGLVSLPFALPHWGAGKSCAESLSKLSNWALRVCSMVHCVFYFLHILKWNSLDCCQIRVLESFVIWIANVLLAFGWVYLSTYFSLNVFVYVCVCVCIRIFPTHKGNRR